MPKDLNRDWDLIIKEVLKEKNTSDVAKRYGVTPQAISYQLNKRNIPSPTGVGKHRTNRIDLKHFENLDEIGAYWLGFIMADGSIGRPSSNHRNDARLTLNISQKDKEMLELLKVHLSYGKSIRDYIPKGTYSENPMSRLCVDSVDFCKILNQYGIVRNKTGKEYISDKIPYHLKRHFIRGFMDGDGSIYISKDTLHLSFCGNFEILSQIKEYLADIVPSSANVIKDKRHDNIYSLNYCCTMAEKILAHLYEDSTVYLSRKFEKFNSVCFHTA